MLRYLTDRGLRKKVQIQLKEGEYRHKLARRVFFADQGAFGTGDYKEVMNEASCPNLVSNAILFWNTLRVSEIVERLRTQGEAVEDDAALKRDSLLPFNHVAPNGTHSVKNYMV